MCMGCLTDSGSKQYASQAPQSMDSESYSIGESRSGMNYSSSGNNYL